eukprot:211552_1
MDEPIPTWMTSHTDDDSISMDTMITITHTMNRTETMNLSPTSAHITENPKHQERKEEKSWLELIRLKLRANEFIEKETTIDDVIEMKRRITSLVEKWDRIIWIDQYLQTNDRLPTLTIISEELGVPQLMARAYLKQHQNQAPEKEKEVDELLSEFNVYNDCVLWWPIIMSKLSKTQTNRVIWLLLNRVAELTPTNV